MVNHHHRGEQSTGPPMAFRTDSECVEIDCRFPVVAHALSTPEPRVEPIKPLQPAELLQPARCMQIQLSMADMYFGVDLNYYSYYSYYLRPRQRLRPLACL